MSDTPSANELIASALQLPLSERAAIASAILESMSPDRSGALQAEIDTAWNSEIARRIEDIDRGRVKTVPSSEVWKRIGGKPVD